MKKYYLWLTMIFGCSNDALTELFNRFETAEEIYNAFRSNIAAAGYKYAEKAEETPLEAAEKLLSEIEGKGITVITIDDELYPKGLRFIPNPPRLLFVKGNAALLKEKLLTVAGSRRITNYTIAAETAVCESLCEEYTLVSSLCDGCEQLACLTAINCGKGCVEVLPCGLDQTYPKGSQLLRQKILMSGGCIVSEFLPDVKANNTNFLRRARISGGISKAMLIFQAGIKSGSLNAAKYSPALFFLPPNNIFSPEYAAAVQYVRNGASLYYGKEDLENAFSEGFSPKKEITIPPSEKVQPEKNTRENPEPKEEKTKNKKALSENKMPSEELFESPLHYKVYRRIASAEQPITFDEIFRNEEIDISDLNEILLDLEISDMISAAPGSRYIAKNQSS